MINMDTWKFAHEYAGKLWWKAGVGLLGPTLLIHIPFYGASDNTMGILSIIITVIQLLFLIGSILLTEQVKSTRCKMCGNQLQFYLGHLRMTYTKETGHFRKSGE